MLKSILNDIKHLLGIEPDYNVFDSDIIIHINSVFMTLHQLGVGPEKPFHITGDSETWGQFTRGRLDIMAVKTYIYLKVRLIFDPPTNSFTITALENQAKEFEWRLMAQREVAPEEPEDESSKPSDDIMEPLTVEEIDALFANKDVKSALNQLKEEITAPVDPNIEVLSFADLDKMFKRQRRKH